LISTPALHDRIGCRTLFATHYFELTALADELPAIEIADIKAARHEALLGKTE